MQTATKCEFFDYLWLEHHGFMEIGFSELWTARVNVIEIFFVWKNDVWSVAKMQYGEACTG